MHRLRRRPGRTNVPLLDPRMGYNDNGELVMDGKHKFGYVDFLGKFHGCEYPPGVAGTGGFRARNQSFDVEQSLPRSADSGNPGPV